MSSGSDSDSDPDATSSFEGVRRYRRGTFYPARIGECVQSWRIQSKLGFGRFSTVWACVDKAQPASHEPTHALKVCRSDDSGWRDEVENLSKIGAHPCVVRMLGSFEVRAGKRAYGCVVTSLHGQSLAQLVKRGVELEHETLLGIARDAAAGLAHVHAAGFVHTDIKPENVLLSPDLSLALLGEPPNLRVYVSRRRGASEVARPYAHVARARARFGPGDFCVIADLGNAEPADAFPPEPGAIQATCYRAPEVVLHLPHDARADVFGLGVVLYETSKRRFLVDIAGETERENCVEHLAQLRALLGPLPEWMLVAAQPVFTRDELTSKRDAEPDTLVPETDLGAVVREMLALDPRARMSAADAADALARVDAMAP
jgi:serine/threonine protein kinase